jgi:hypothetical protein
MRRSTVLSLPLHLVFPGLIVLSLRVRIGEAVTRISGYSYKLTRDGSTTKTSLLAFKYPY